MTLSDQDLMRIVTRSTSLSERISAEKLSQYKKSAEPFLNRWREVAAANEPERLDKRIKWAGWTQEQVERALTGLPEPAETPPSWTKLFRRCLATELDPAVVPSYLSADDPFPFEEFYVPFVETATAEVIESTPLFVKWFDQNSKAQLQRALLTRLSTLALETLYFEFQLARSRRSSGFSRLIRVQSQSDANSVERYAQFIQSLCTNLPKFFKEYVVLARLFGTVLNFWVKNTVLLLERLEADQKILKDKLGYSQPLGQIAEFETDLSDPHNDGKTVAILRFTNGFRVVYKPRSVEMAAAFNLILDWLNAKAPEIRLKKIDIVERDGYGWCQHVTYSACDNYQQVERYYNRLGMLLCLFHLLDGTDLHHENIIASGEHPLIIDLETLFHASAEARGFNQQNSRDIAATHFSKSVIRTHLLPYERTKPKSKRNDDSGFGYAGGEPLAQKVRAWTQINCDQMSRKWVQAQAGKSQNAPTIGEQRTYPFQYIESMVRGFQSAYRICISAKAELLAPDGILGRFATLRSRFVFRDTSIYFNVLERACKPKPLRDGALFSIELEMLTRAFTNGVEATAPSNWAFLDYELQSLEQGDIPHFSVDVGHSSMQLGDRLIKSLFSTSSMTQVRDKVTQLSLQDMYRQSDIIEATISSKFIGQLEDIKQIQAHQQALDVTQSPLELVLNLADDLTQRAIYNDTGTGASWVGLTYMDEAQQAKIVALRDDLHSGSLGVAIFLAAAYKASSNSDLKQLALDALDATHRSLVDAGAGLRYWQKMKIGGALGVGSVLYGLSLVHNLLQEQRPLDIAQLAFEHLSFEKIASDRSYDVMDGSAGALLGLLALYVCTGDVSVLQRAIACGEHLLSQRVLLDGGHLAWHTVDDNALAGMSHGAAGIGYALSRLFEVTSDQRFKEATVEAILYEQTMFDESKQNWPNTLGGKPQYQVRWCHGAPGVGLARLGSLGALDASYLCDDIQAALQTTMNAAPATIDNMCCGTFGRIEFITTAAQRLGRPELCHYARRATEQALTRVQQDGAFTLPFLPPRVNRNNNLQLGFYHGISGIGYQILRTYDPDSFPSVMLWEL